MADIREPVAWVNSARMSGAFYMYIEGASDGRFWSRFIDSNHVKLQVCHGCEGVLDVAMEHIKQGMLDFVAVIDNDFGVLQGNRPKVLNLFFTDDHDLEMMMYHKGGAFYVMKNSIDRGEKIAQYENNGHDLLDEVLEMTGDIGYCKLAAHNHNLNLLFTHENKKTREIERPKYEDIMDGSSGRYLGISRVVEKVTGFTKSHQECPPKVEDTMRFVCEEKRNEYDKWHLSNGHDVSYLIPYLIRRRCKHRNTRMDKEFIDSVLYAAYTKNDLKLTEIYAEMDQWSKEKGVKLFK